MGGKRAIRTRELKDITRKEGDDDEEGTRQEFPTKRYS